MKGIVLKLVVPVILSSWYCFNVLLVNSSCVTLSLLEIKKLDE